MPWMSWEPRKANTPSCPNLGQGCGLHVTGTFSGSRSSGSQVLAQSTGSLELSVAHPRRWGDIHLTLFVVNGCAEDAKEDILRCSTLKYIDLSSQPP